MAKNQKFIQAIWTITEDLWDIEEFDNALSAMLEVIAKAVGCEAGNIWFLNKDDNRLYAMFHVGETDILGTSVAVGEGVAGLVCETGETVMINGVKNDKRFVDSIDEETGVNARDIICVPLKNGDEAIGAVQLINKLNGDPFDEEELLILKRGVTITSMTIEERGFEPEFLPKPRTIISLRDVKREFLVGDTTLKVLKGVNLDIYENEFLVVLGESGCGKSTMLNIVGGMDFLSSGTLTVEGQDYSKPTEAELTQYRRDYVGFIFQAYNLMPNLTAQENVEFIAELSENSMDSAEAIAKVGLSERANNYPSQMSGGQQQRVSIARAIVKRPKLILADEPTAALDFTTGQEVLMVIEDIVKNQNTTVVMITHNVEIAKMANRVVKLKNGKVSSIKINMQPLSAAEIEW